MQTLHHWNSRFPPKIPLLESSFVSFANNEKIQARLFQEAITTSLPSIYFYDDLDICICICNTKGKPIKPILKPILKLNSISQLSIPCKSSAVLINPTNHPLLLLQTQSPYEVIFLIPCFYPFLVIRAQSSPQRSGEVTSSILLRASTTTIYSTYRMNGIIAICKGE